MLSKIKTSWMLLAAGLLLIPAGCVGYSSYPKVEGVAPGSPNFIQVKPVVIASLKAVAEKYHPDSAGPYAVNLPAGLTREGREDVFHYLDVNAVPLSHRTDDLPIYHVGRVWVRGADAKVDIIRPVLELGATPTGAPAYQGMTVWLQGGANRWSVEFIQPWSIGVVEPPELHYVDEEPEG